LVGKNSNKTTVKSLYQSVLIRSMVKIDHEPSRQWSYEAPSSQEKHGVP
jgi:hypothetical protein